ncbi:DUF192 domain-containing protein [bacterium]|nr:DUF192 domain-containing protein [bacterium]
MSKALKYILIVVFVLIPAVFWVVLINPFKTTETQLYEIKVGDQKLMVNLAETEQERSKGLSGRERLDGEEGLLFVFSRDVQSPFWMRDMKFAIDIIFIDQNFFVTGIKNDAQPCESILKCPLIIPNDKYRYVLEVNSGYANLHGIKKGTQLDLTSVTLRK